MSHAANAAEPSFDDRLVAECVRVIEHDDRQRFNEPAADAAAREGGGDFENRLITRACSITSADELRRSIHQLRSALAWILTIAVLIAFLLGAATARTTMTPIDGTRVNFYWVLGGVLGVQSILLVIWLIVALKWCIGSKRSPRDSADSPMLISLGRLVVAIGQWLGAKLHAAGPGRSVISATGRIFATGRIGFWTFSSITHAIWLAFNVGALTLILLLLAARQYTFVWETTILSERYYVAMTQWLSAPPRAVGFSVPTDEDISLSQWRGEEVAPVLPEGASQRWASLLVASIALYGFGPRLVLLGLSMSMRRHAQLRYRLDTSLPEYERLRPVLMPQTRSLGVVDPDDESEHEEQSPGIPIPGLSRQRPPGPPAIVGLEISPPETGWPPSVNGVPWTDLGIIESRDDRMRIITTLQSSKTEPDPLVIVSDLTNTPDRGLGSALGTLAAAVSQPPLLVLSAGQKLRDRGYDADHLAQRVADWRELARQSGLDDEAIIELDLDHLTDVAAAQFARRFSNLSNQSAGTDQPSQTHTRRIESAFALIEQHASTWIDRGQAPSESDQFALHKDIAAHYRHQAGSFRSLLSLRPDSPRALLDEITSGASRFVDLLPNRLRRSPKWLAAGALAGAFGCVATSAVISPIAIAALPSWSAIGAAIAAALQPSGGEDGEPTASVPEAPDYADVVRAAALFAVTLEMQGHDETSITRVLDQTFTDDEMALSDKSEIHGWLDACRHRFDVALTAMGQ